MVDELLDVDTLLHHFLEDGDDAHVLTALCVELAHEGQDVRNLDETTLCLNDRLQELLRVRLKVFGCVDSVKIRARILDEVKEAVYELSIRLDYALLFLEFLELGFVRLVFSALHCDADPLRCFAKGLHGLVVVVEDVYLLARAVDEELHQVVIRPRLREELDDHLHVLRIVTEVLRLEEVRCRYEALAGPRHLRELHNLINVTQLYQRLERQIRFSD